MRIFIFLLISLSFAFSQEIKVFAIVKGQVKKVYVKEGDTVKKGDLLMEIDPSLYIAEKERLINKKKELEARFWKIERDYMRLKELFERDLLAETRLEDQKIRYDTALAQIKQVESRIKKVDILISYTKIFAPVSGKIKAILTPEGSYVNGELIPQVVIVIEVE